MSKIKDVSAKRMQCSHRSLYVDTILVDTRLLMSGCIMKWSPLDRSGATDCKNQGLVKWFF